MNVSELVRKILAKEARISIIGLGYVGLPLAVEATKVGFTVIGIEQNPERVGAINRGENYIADVNGRDLAQAVRGGKLRASQSFDALSETNVTIICVPTPLDKNKNPDTSYIQHSIEQALPYLNQGHLIVLESTTYPGTTEETILPQLEAHGFKVGQDIYLAYSPERVDPGNTGHALKDISKVVGGITPACTDLTRALYETLLQKPVFTVSSTRAAEMTKLLENIFRVVNVSLVNELAILCDRMNIDIWEVIEAAKTKPFGFMPFYPGPGMGGHCIPVDPFYLVWKAKEYDFSPRFIELAGEINDNMPQYVVDKAAEILNGKKKAINGSRVLLMGVAYKRNIDDIRESPALKVAHLLMQRGALLSYHDPYVPEVLVDGKKLQSVSLTAEALERSDLTLITTDHSNVDYERVVEYAPLIYDTRNAIAGFQNGHVHRLGAMVNWSKRV